MVHFEKQSFFLGVCTYTIAHFMFAQSCKQVTDTVIASRDDFAMHVPS